MNRTATLALSPSEHRHYQRKVIFQSLASEKRRWSGPATRLDGTSVDIVDAPVYGQHRDGVLVVEFCECPTCSERAAKAQENTK